jgi:hypothetical protein
MHIIILRYNIIIIYCHSMQLHTIFVASNILEVMLVFEYYIRILDLI